MMCPVEVGSPSGRGGASIVGTLNVEAVAQLLSMQRNNDLPHDGEFMGQVSCIWERLVSEE
jgi:hypothetical protein